MTTTHALMSLALLVILLDNGNAELSSSSAAVEQGFGEESISSPALESESILGFEAWEMSHRNNEIDKHKHYHSEDERLLRKRIFYRNKVLVEKHNAAYDAGHTSWKMTLNSPFADLTADEFSSLYLMDPQQCSATTSTSNDAAEVTAPTGKTTLEANDKTLSVDWRTKGIMTPVKDQGHCGSCWTFSTSGCLEAHTCLAYNKDCSHWKGLAEQQLVDCAGGFNNFGCSGGLPSQAYEYIKYSGGMDFENSYEYKATDGKECLAGDGVVGAKVAEVYNITSGDEDDLVTAISQVGPVSIAYQVSPDFRFYKHGVYDSYNVTSNSTMCNNTNMDVNHAVVAIGLGTTADSKHNNDGDGGTPFYIVRNSWGTSWGMEGHFWMKRGENLCGVSDCASYPIVPVPAKNKKSTTKKNQHPKANGEKHPDNNGNDNDNGNTDKDEAATVLVGAAEGGVNTHQSPYLRKN
mmetsp:Transcript_27629/g.60828  ORF Transcript_27629/g.60828 Transcript_27629/m.60828 type:complete len:463 (-) Transcript_27629:197-1585(-)|eukprot:CAMPEP_0168184772 /NCGR_PEP_ID=MMETSP0139_2-20121125/13433_1 /TAXON_ID=44445 /ORGANISM="Pseudo-nitzschia australis, Strain 10249 10 AB" /LENGTH=462 /DNA_ID=CAMNT_0008106447 /DNA_START=62 /DNA_END=1450 /DNA_ORIENTATION=+